MGTYQQANPVFDAAKSGCLDKIPVRLLMPNLLAKHKGETALHIAARYGHLGQLPAEILTAANLLHKASWLAGEGNTVVHVAASAGHLNQIPAEVLGESGVLTCTNRHLETPLHLATTNGYISQVPRKMLVENVIMLKDKHGQTALHLAAKHGYLNQLPPQILTSQNLGRIDGYETSAIRYAAVNGNIHQIPPSSLSPELLLDESTMERTTLHSIKEYGYLDQILGVDFGENERAKFIVGEEWWEKNNHILDEIKRAKKHMCNELQCANETNMDLF